MESSGLPGKTQAEARLTRYLLGAGSPRERERLEAEYFADQDAFENMLSAEDDLIDAYARGDLSAEERRQFEDRFLSSAQGRERVQFARTLAGAVAVAPSLPQPSPAIYQPGFFHRFGPRRRIATGRGYGRVDFAGCICVACV